MAAISGTGTASNNQSESSEAVTVVVVKPSPALGGNCCANMCRPKFASNSVEIPATLINIPESSDNSENSERSDAEEIPETSQRSSVLEKIRCCKKSPKGEDAEEIALAEKAAEDGENQDKKTHHGKKHKGKSKVGVGGKHTHKSKNVVTEEESEAEDTSKSRKPRKKKEKLCCGLPAKPGQTRFWGNYYPDKYNLFAMGGCIPESSDDDDSGDDDDTLSWKECFAWGISGLGFGALAAAAFFMGGGSAAMTVAGIAGASGAVSSGANIEGSNNTQIGSGNTGLFNINLNKGGSESEIDRAEQLKWVGRSPDLRLECMKRGLYYISPVSGAWYGFNDATSVGQCVLDLPREMIKGECKLVKEAVSLAEEEANQFRSHQYRVLFRKFNLTELADQNGFLLRFLGLRELNDQLQLVAKKAGMQQIRLRQLQTEVNRIDTDTKKFLDQKITRITTGANDGGSFSSSIITGNNKKPQPSRRRRNLQEQRREKRAERNRTKPTTTATLNFLKETRGADAHEQDMRQGLNWLNNAAGKK